MSKSQRNHTMPFGAQVRPDGRVRFRLWAPDLATVTLVLEPRDRERILVPLDPSGDGWFERTIPPASSPASSAASSIARSAGRSPASAAANTAAGPVVGPGDRYRYRLPDGLEVPDPASRRQPDGVHGASEIVDPHAYAWKATNWRGRPWETFVIYELHVGAFTPEGTFTAAAEQLSRLATLGVTAVELMPVAAFPGERNWGYDGVQPFAPAESYGTPEDLKSLVDAIHAHGMAAMLDVVYNHFGPEGNYLHCYAKPFFTSRYETPWGAAIDFEGPHSAVVREFFIQNALFWLEEYGFDGLRLDAVHAITDRSKPDFLEELAERVRQGPGAEREVHLVLENDKNESHYLRRLPDGRPRQYVAQWNDDIHHAFHCLLTGEDGGYYQDYADDLVGHLGRCLSEGFAYQGDVSAFRGGQTRGEQSRHLPLPAFVSFIQNHDQIGNRAFGERLTTLCEPQAVRAAVVVLLLAPSVPLIFMGEEIGSRRPFLFFSDFGPDLAGSVTEGRRREFASFPEFADPQAAQRIPDPQDPAVFGRTVIDWRESGRGEAADWERFYGRYLTVRHRELVPRLKHMPGDRADWRRLGERALEARWVLGDDSRYCLIANLGDEAVDSGRPPGRLIADFHLESGPGEGVVRLPGWSAGAFLQEREDVGPRDAS